MMTSAEIRKNFLDFFREKNHEIVPSAPIVVKNDPTLMFTNAGMNQFKDFFLGNKKSAFPRVADTQKCLRVSGKHNDLEEVGVDTYHHTMFEMLGNWSFGDYFKKEAIAWSWELLTEIYKIPKDKLYVTVFEGDQQENLPADDEAKKEWEKWISPDRILLGNKKDNFWEMGDTGPCGPCTEIHVDCRSDEERKTLDGSTLVNNDHPQVIEIWNNVFIQYNRLKNGNLEALPAKHVDTGMGLERLVRVLQQKNSNYDTDIFTGTINQAATITGKQYTGGDDKTSVAFRVLADHIRAIAFTIADGQLPSNTGAGYVIRRILRRAARYYYSYLDYKQPLLHQLIPLLTEQFAEVFPNLKEQENFVSKVIREEEEAFLRTLEQGIKRFNSMAFERKNQKIVTSRSVDDKGKSFSTFSGLDAFLLNDTYGFPVDLTNLMAKEQGFVGVDMEDFEALLEQQKDRSRAATAVDTEDWITVSEAASNGSAFIGYKQLEADAKLVKYRKVKAKGKESYQLVLDQTPFYAESGGQVGDTGELVIDGEKVFVTDTKKENELIIHFTDKMPASVTGNITAKVNGDKRKSTALHHSATHLLHAALRKVLGTHVAQKGSLVNADYLRFDFSHFAKATDEELAAIEAIINQKIRENISVVINELPKEEALKLGAMALFGEKYGDVVRVVMMDKDYSVELCGGTHVASTGELGFFKITSEAAVAAGVRRIEAVTGAKAEAYINAALTQLQQAKEIFKNPKDLPKAIEALVEENTLLRKKIEQIESVQLEQLGKKLIDKVITINGVQFLGEVIDVPSADALKKLCYGFKGKIQDYVVVLAANIQGKASVVIGIDDAVVISRNLDAGKMIKEIVSPLIKGGGGGQKNLATAGGQDSSALAAVISKIKELL